MTTLSAHCRGEHCEGAAAGVKHLATGEAVIAVVFPSEQKRLSLMGNGTSIGTLGAHLRR